MTNSTVKNWTIVAIIICVVYLVLTIFYYHIDKHLSGWPFIILTLLIPTSFIAIVVLNIIWLIKVIRSRQNFTFKFCTPAIIMSVTLTYSLFSPYRLNSRSFESEVEFSACFEGTKNNVHMNFRKNSSFELHKIGILNLDEQLTGHWSKKGDTLFLEYDDERIYQLGDTVLITKGYLIPIGQSVDKKKFPRPLFYLGDC